MVVNFIGVWVRPRHHLCLDVEDVHEGGVDYNIDLIRTIFQLCHGVALIDVDLAERNQRRANCLFEHFYAGRLVIFYVRVTHLMDVVDFDEVVF